MPPAAEPREVRLQPFTNLRKVFWSDDGYTKGALVAHYDALPPIMPPSRRSRPVLAGVATLSAAIQHDPVYLVTPT